MSGEGEGCLATELQAIMGSVRSTGRASQREAVGHWKSLPILRMKFRNANMVILYYIM